MATEGATAEDVAAEPFRQPTYPESRPQDCRSPYSREDKIHRLLWNLVYALLFRPSPLPLWAWRAWLLKAFGARLGPNVFIHPTATVFAPWKLTTGEYIWVDHHVRLYNPHGIELGSRITISQHAFLCTTSHDFQALNLPLFGRPIRVESDAWITADVFVAPGVTVGQGAVLGARAVVVKDVEPWAVVAGNPARFIKRRILSDPKDSQA